MAILSLGRLGSGVAGVKEALTQLEKDANPTIRMHVTIAKVLTGSMDESAIPSLIQAMDSKDNPTADAATTALSRLGKQSPEKLIPALVEALNTNEQSITRNALKVLRNMKNQAAEALPSVAAAYEKVDPKIRPLVVQAVVEMDSTGDHALPLCMKALGDPNPIARKDALMGAMRYRSKLEAYLTPLIESLNDPDEENKLLALGVIRGLGNKAAQAVPSLIALTNGTNQRVRVSAISTLGAFNPPNQEALSALGKALSDKDDKVKTASLNVLRTIGQRDPTLVTPILEKALESEKEQKTKHSVTATLDGLKKAGEERPMK